MRTVAALSGRARLFALALCSLAVAVATVARRGGPPAEISFLSLFACFSYASIACCYVLSSSRSGRGAIGESTLLAVGAALAVVAWFSPLRVAKLELIGVGSLGIAGYVYDALAATRDDERRARLAELRDALIIPVAVVQVPFFLWLNAAINPVYDAHVLAFERLLRVPFSALAMQSYHRAGTLGEVATACYLALPIGLSVVAFSQPSAERATRVLSAMLLAGACGFLLYLICPVVGPVRAFLAPLATQLPDVPAVPFAVVAHVPRNGMPSLHTAWAVLIVSNVAALGARWRVALVSFAALSLWAAIGRYEHWFLDLVVAIPMAAAIQLAVVGSGQASTDRRSGSVQSAGCMVGVLVWLVGLRLGMFVAWPLVLAWAAVGLTVTIPLWLIWRRSKSAR